MEPTKPEPSLAQIVDEIDAIAKAEATPAREEGIVIDATGQTVKLGEELPRIEIFYGNGITLPNGLFTPEG